MKDPSAKAAPFPAPQLGLDIATQVAVEPESADVDHGAVFTRRWVVELILDLAGYTADRPLDELVAIEPACGEGAFLVPMVERLSAALRRQERELADAVGSIKAFDLQSESVEASMEAVTAALVNLNWPRRSAAAFARKTVHHGDFLLGQHPFEEADFVIGNPPYIRLEAVPAARGEAYRKACPTMGGRADIYVGFIEVGLKALKPNGTLSFICADRWMRNQYGRLLRQLVGEHFSVETAIEMHDVDAFADEVSAYPSIVTIRRRTQQPALVAEATGAFSEGSARELANWSRKAKPGHELSGLGYQAAVLAGWFPGSTGWPAGSPARLAALQDLEARLPTLENEKTGTRVGIGVATGADKVYVTKDRDAAELERMLPMAMAADTMSGSLEWSGHYLVNPWRNDGSGLVDPGEFPRLKAYYEEHITPLKGRNIAKRRPDDWFRTIDRVDHELIFKPKLLFPDIKASIHPVLDKGKTYPHHNLYWVTSDEWDLEVLGGLLLSRVAQLFIESYAVKMRGGYLRFQAQYLRRIRIPRLEDVGKADARKLTQAFRARDVETATETALKLYGLTELPN